MDTSDLPDYSVGRSWDTDFSNATADAASFNVVNYVYVTDPATSLPAVQQNNTLYGGGPFQISSISTKSKMAAADVFVRFRQINGNTLGGQSGGRGSTMAGAQRGAYLWTAGTLYGEGADYTGITRDWAGGYGGTRFDQHTPFALQTDTTDQRCIRIQVFQDSMRYKAWIESGGTVGGGEPTNWNYLTRVGAGEDFATDFTAGLYAWVLDASFISHLTITELTRTSTNLLHNSSLLLTDSATGLPLWWAPATVGSAASASVETIADQNGIMRPCLKVASSPAGGAATGGGLWQQTLINSASPGPNTVTTAVRQWPQSPSFTPLVLVTVWSKGSGLSEPGGGNGLCTSYVNYYYDGAGNLPVLREPHRAPILRGAWADHARARGRRDGGRRDVGVDEDAVCDGLCGRRFALQLDREPGRSRQHGGRHDLDW